jgi:hypothetical protein
MSVSLHHQATADRGRPSSSAVTVLLPWARLIGGLAAIEPVVKLGLVATDEGVDLWVVFRDEDDAGEAEVSRLEREYRIATGPSPFELHIVPLTMVDEANLPPFETILTR